MKHQKYISTMAEPNAGRDGRPCDEWPPPPPGASSRWVGRGRCRRICLDSLNRMRKKLFIDGIHYILFFNNPSSIVSNTITFHPPCALRRSHFLSFTSPVMPACFWLVVACICVIYWGWGNVWPFIFCSLSLSPAFTCEAPPRLSSAPLFSCLRFVIAIHKFGNNWKKILVNKRHTWQDSWRNNLFTDIVKK